MAKSRRILNHSTRQFTNRLPAWPQVTFLVTFASSLRSVVLRRSGLSRRDAITFSKHAQQDSNLRPAD